LTLVTPLIFSPWAPSHLETGPLFFTRCSQSTQDIGMPRKAWRWRLETHSLPPHRFLGRPDPYLCGTHQSQAVELGSNEGTSRNGMEAFARPKITTSLISQAKLPQAPTSDSHGTNKPGRQGPRRVVPVTATCDGGCGMDRLARAAGWAGLGMLLFTVLIPRPPSSRNFLFRATLGSNQSFP
jgi:hypothetical protein